MADAPSLLLVEDDDALRERLAKALASRGIDVLAASNVQDAAQTARANPPELAVIDLRVGADSGLSLIPTLLEIDPATRIVVLTGYGSVATAVQAVRSGAIGYLTKPASVDDILRTLQEPQSTDVAVPAEPMSLDRVEWEHINRVLVDCDNNISEAARALGLHRRTLQRKLAKFPSRR